MVKVSFGALGCGILFLAVGAVFVTGIWAVYSRDTRIERQGERARGEISAKDSLISADGDSDFYVEYSFETTDGHLIEARRAVAKPLWDDLDIGDEVEIRYDPALPERNFPRGGGNTSIGLAIFISLLGTAAFLFGVALIGGSFSRSFEKPLPQSSSS